MVSATLTKLAASSSSLPIQKCCVMAGERGRGKGFETFPPAPYPHFVGAPPSPLPFTPPSSLGELLAYRSPPSRAF
jgi:hypothetical protein